MKVHGQNTAGEGSTGEKTQSIQVILWIVTTATALTIVYSAQPWNAGDGYSRSVSALYASLSKTSWSLCVCWVFFACINGYGGFVNTILCWKAWIPFSRLTYCLYLVHPVIDWIRTAFQRERIFPAHYFMVYNLFGDFMVSLGVAFVLSMCFEAPIRNLEKIIFPEKRKEKSEEGRVERNETKIPEFGAEMKPRFAPRDPNYSSSMNALTYNSGIDNRAFSSHL